MASYSEDTLFYAGFQKFRRKDGILNGIVAIILLIFAILFFGVDLILWGFKSLFGGGKKKKKPKEKKSKESDDGEQVDQGTAAAAPPPQQSSAAATASVGAAAAMASLQPVSAATQNIPIQTEAVNYRMNASGNGSSMAIQTEDEIKMVDVSSQGNVVVHRYAGLGSGTDSDRAGAFMTDTKNRSANKAYSTFLVNGQFNQKSFNNARASLEGLGLAATLNDPRAVNEISARALGQAGGAKQDGFVPILVSIQGGPE